MDELAELRRRKIAEMQSAQSEEANLQTQVAQLDALGKGKLSRDALVRYGNVRTVHPELWLQALVTVARMPSPVSDAQYKAVLEQFQQRKRAITIRKV